MSSYRTQISKVMASIVLVCGVAAQATPRPATVKDYRIDVVARGLDNPYSVAILPGGDILVTEKPGHLRRIRNGILLERSVSGLPPVLAQFNDGLMDIVPHPRFVENHVVYLSLTKDVAGKQVGAIVRGRYADGVLTNVEDIFHVGPRTTKFSPFTAGRIAFLPDETLVFTVAAEFDEDMKAQSLTSMLGKTIRITGDGKIPHNNPFVRRPGARPEIFSWGHRNPLGIVCDPTTHRIYATENGPRGGDELNMIASGKNYGWPVVTHGREYLGGYTSPFRAYPGMEQPLIDWTPSPAPSGLTQCHHCQWPEWEGDLFSGMLAGRHVRRIRVRDGAPVWQEKLLVELGERIRDVRFGPDGALYVLTDGPGAKLLKLSRAVPASLNHNR